MVTIMKKVASKLFVYLLVVFSILFSCNSKNTANKIVLFEGDKLEDRVIVYCTGYSFGSCKSGIYIVPTYENHYDEKGNYAEYVEKVNSNSKWMIVKTIRIKDNNESYWVINKNFDLESFDCSEVNCDSIIQSHVVGSLNYDEFTAKKKELGITLKFE